MLPLWLLWKSSVFASAIIESIILFKQPSSSTQQQQHPRHNGAHVQVKITIHNLVLHLLLVTFECLLSYKLNSESPLLWINVYSPLLIASCSCITFCMWCCKNGVTLLNFELFTAMTFPMFFLIPLRLDNIITCPWEIVFLPVSIILLVALVKLLYSMIFCGIELQYTEMNRGDDKKSARILLLALTFFPLFIFQAMLVDKIDDNSQMPFSLVTLPLMLSLLAAISLTFFSSGSDNLSVRNFRMLLNMMGINGDIVSINACCFHRASDTESVITQVSDNENAKIPIVPHYSFETPD
jgi:hypothetical protein